MILVHLQRHCWSEQLTPVIVSAQEKLATRANLHREKVTTEGEPHPTTSSHTPPRLPLIPILPLPPPLALDPAAHLDPKSYNIYGGVSLSLSKVSVPLDPKAMMEQKRRHGSPQERALMDCRTMYLRYLAGNCNTCMCTLCVWYMYVGDTYMCMYLYVYTVCCTCMCTLCAVHVCVHCVRYMYVYTVHAHVYTVHAHVYTVHF